MYSFSPISFLFFFNFFALSHHFYALQVLVNGTCEEYDTFTDHVGKGANDTIPAIHYYRINATIPITSQQHLLNDAGQHR
jgi:hypothetical protein